MTEAGLVRPATPEDVETWRQLRYDGILASPQAFLVTADEAAAFSVDIDLRQLAEGGRFLAFQGETAVGLIALNRNRIPRAAHRAEIGPFYVVPAARGTGTADALIAAVSDYASAAGIWQLELYVNQDNARAIAFYRRHGFVPAGTIPNAILGADGLEHDQIMIRSDAP
ncbi:MAG: GNAT family N-acetyltransferase [Pseudomonadota bacterium]